MEKIMNKSCLIPSLVFLEREPYKGLKLFRRWCELSIDYCGIWPKSVLAERNYSGVSNWQWMGADSGREITMRRWRHSAKRHQSLVRQGRWEGKTDISTTNKLSYSRDVTATAGTISRKSEYPPIIPGTGWSLLALQPPVKQLPKHSLSWSGIVFLPLDSQDLRKSRCSPQDQI